MVIEISRLATDYHRVQSSFSFIVWSSLKCLSDRGIMCLSRSAELHVQMIKRHERDRHNYYWLVAISDALGMRESVIVVLAYLQTSHPPFYAFFQALFGDRLSGQSCFSHTHMTLWKVSILGRLKCMVETSNERKAKHAVSSSKARHGGNAVPFVIKWKQQ